MLKGLEQIRKIDWGRSYLWNVKFGGGISGQNSGDPPPSPFDTFFPAIDIEENLLSLESTPFEVYNTSIKIPSGTSPFDVKITFYDDINGTLRQWLTQWANEVILGAGSAVATLTKAVRLLTIEKLDYSRNVLEVSNYWVYPEGPLYFTGNSEASIPTYNMTFIIAASSLRTEQ